MQRGHFIHRCLEWCSQYARISIVFVAKVDNDRTNTGGEKIESYPAPDVQKRQQSVRPHMPSTAEERAAETAR
jgi:hypothetical protein